MTRSAIVEIGRGDANPANDYSGETDATCAAGSSMRVFSAIMMAWEKFMQIRINTDHVVGGHPAVVAPVSSMDDGALSRTGNHIAGMQVRLADENGDMRGPGDRRSVMEAGLEGRQPMAAMHRAGTMGASLPGQKFKGPS